MKTSEIRQIIREELERKLDEFVSKEMQQGTAWKVSDKGYGAKSRSGKTSYFYGANDTENKSKADKFSKSND